MRTLLAVLVLVVSGCGDEGFDAPTCMPGQLVIEGTIDGVPIAATINATGFSFINALGDSDGQVKVSTGTTTHLSLQFPDLVANGDDVSARGQVTLATPALMVGNCETG